MTTTEKLAEREAFEKLIPNIGGMTHFHIFQAGAEHARAALAATPAADLPAQIERERAASKDMIASLEEVIKKQQALIDSMAATPASPDLYVGLIERLMRLSTRLGIAHEGGVEHFSARLEDRLYTICRVAEGLLDSLAATPAAAEPFCQNCGDPDAPWAAKRLDGTQEKFCNECRPGDAVKPALAATPAAPPADAFEACAEEIEQLQEKWISTVAASCIVRKYAALAATPAAPQWQPIETAPKDGTEFLLRKPTFKGVVVAYSLDPDHPDWDGADFYETWSHDPIYDATEWLPLNLPAATPAAAPKAGQGKESSK